MKVIVKIGHLDILLPDETGVSTILKTLAKGVVVHDRLYDGKVVVTNGSPSLEMKVVPAKTKFVDEEGGEVKASKTKRLVGPSLLLELHERE